jgi:hypothetical protein
VALFLWGQVLGEVSYAVDFDGCCLMYYMLSNC